MDRTHNQFWVSCTYWRSTRRCRLIRGKKKSHQKPIYKGLSSSMFQANQRCIQRTGRDSASITSWLCWRSRLSRRHSRSIWANISRCERAHATLDRHPFHYCACHFDGHHLPDDRSALPHLWLGTHYSLPPALLNCDSFYFEIQT